MRCELIRGYKLLFIDPTRAMASFSSRFAAHARPAAGAAGAANATVNLAEAATRAYATAYSVVTNDRFLEAVLLLAVLICVVLACYYVVFPLLHRVLTIVRAIKDIVGIMLQLGALGIIFYFVVLPRLPPAWSEAAVRAGDVVVDAMPAWLWYAISSIARTVFAVLVPGAAKG